MNSFKKFAGAVLAGMLVMTSGIIMLSSTESPNFADSVCVHSGNHYSARLQTESEYGVKEYWVCCECHEIFLTKPSKGTWIDAGTAYVAVDPTDVRYIAPNTKYHDNQGVIYSEDGKTAVDYVPVQGVTEVVIPEGVTDIGTVFQGDDAITSITIPSTVTTIEGAAFRDCNNLETLIIEEGVTEILSDRRSAIDIRGAFQYCSSLKNVVIPSTVVKIGAYAFGSCGNQLNLFVYPKSRPSGWDRNWSMNTFLISEHTVYWGGSWHLDSNNNPVIGK